MLRVLFMVRQRGSAADVARIPGPEATAGELYTWVRDTAGLPLYADTAARRYVPYR